VRLLRDSGDPGPPAEPGPGFSSRGGEASGAPGRPGTEPHRAGHYRVRPGPRGKGGLVSLVRALCAVRGVRWIRLLYLYPSRVDDGIVDLLRSEEKVCRYLDVPVQHIDPGILRRMGRTYGPDAIYRMLDRLRDGVPGLFLRTSLIVGFPGETRAPSTACSVSSTKRGGITSASSPTRVKRGPPRSGCRPRSRSGQRRSGRAGCATPRPTSSPRATRRGSDKPSMCSWKNRRPRKGRRPPPGPGAGGRRFHDPLRVRRETGLHRPRPRDGREGVGSARSRRALQEFRFRLTPVGPRYTNAILFSWQRRAQT